MTIDINDLLNSIMGTLDRVSFIDSKSIPDIDLYMDQVTTFMNQNLKNTSRSQSEDKILTKTMVNNYVKNDLLPPPEKKKYNREHVLVLLFVYYFKNVLSISDIQTMLSPIVDKYFDNPQFSMQSVYEEVRKLGDEQIDNMKRDIQNKYSKASETFQEVSAEEQEFLQMFAFICTLCFDVYVKKLLIEEMIDQMATKYPYVSKVEKEKVARKNAKEVANRDRAVAKEMAIRDKAIKEKALKEKMRKDRGNS